MPQPEGKVMRTLWIEIEKNEWMTYPAYTGFLLNFGERLICHGKERLKTDHQAQAGPMT